MLETIKFLMSINYVKCNYLSLTKVNEVFSEFYEEARNRMSPSNHH